MSIHTALSSITYILLLSGQSFKRRNAGAIPLTELQLWAAILSRPCSQQQLSSFPESFALSTWPRLPRGRREFYHWVHNKIITKHRHIRCMEIHNLEIINMTTTLHAPPEFYNIMMLSLCSGSMLKWNGLSVSWLFLDPPGTSKMSARSYFYTEAQRRPGL